MKIHLDTDISGDMDDLCALALALRWPGAESVGVTMAAEAGGRRATHPRYALHLARRDGDVVASGAYDTKPPYRYVPGLSARGTVVARAAGVSP